MFSNVVVGVDEHEGWHDALAFAGQLLSEDGVLTLAHIHVSRGVLSGHGGDYEAAYTDRAAQLLERARTEADVPAAVRCQRAHSVGEGLHELADELGADLLVVGTSSRGRVGRVLKQDDTRAALNGASCAVAVVPEGFEHGAPVIENVGVAYDGSPESEVALATARTIADALGARLSGLEVVSIPIGQFMGPVAVGAATVQDIVNDARLRVASVGGIEAHSVYGEPAEGLARYSGSVDLLVVGSRGYGPLGRLVHGSTSRDLARTSRCPLLVLPRGARRAAAPEPSSEHGDSHPVTAKVN